MFRAAARLMSMDDAVWARHANPWSGWTRLIILPLFALAIWSRVWLGWWCLAPVLALIVWTWWNPRAFPPPTRTDAWISRGVLGERVFLTRAARPIPRHHLRAAMVLSFVSGLGLIPLIYGLVTLEIWPTLTGLITTVGAKLWFIDRMVWLLADTERADAM